MGDRVRNVTKAGRRGVRSIPVPGTPSGMGSFPVGPFDLQEGAIDHESKLVEGVITSKTLSSLEQPDAPSGVTVTTGLEADGKAYIEIAWTADEDATHHEIRYKRTSETTYTYLPAAASPTRVRGLLPNTAYHIGVQSYNQVGNSTGYATDQTITTAADSAAPGVPQNFTSSAGMKTVTVSWDAVNDSDLKDYEVVFALDSGFNDVLQTQYLRATVASIEYPFANTAIYARVRSRDTSGNVSAWSPVASATTAYVETPDIKPNAVDATLLANNAVTVDKVAAGAITNAKLVDGAVDAAKLAAAAVTAAKLSIEVGGGNFIKNSSFEVDTNNDGTADNYQFAANGLPGSGTNSLVTSPLYHGAKAQKCVVSGLDTGSYRGIVQVVSGLRSSTKYTHSVYADIQSLSNAKIQMYIDWQTSSNVNVGSTVKEITATTTGLTRFSITGTTPATATQARIYLIVRGTATGGASTVIFDGHQLELGDVLTAYAPKPDEILPNTITSTEIADNAVTSGKIVAGAVIAGKIAANAVTANEIAANAVTAGKIAANAVTASTIEAGAVTAGKIAANAVTATEIAAGSITTVKLAAGAVTANEIAAGSITAVKVAANAIEADKIAANAVVAGKIAANAVVANNIQAGAITGDHIAAATITGAKIQAGSISAADAVFATAAITNADIQSLEVDKITAGTLSAAVVLSGSIRTANSGARVEIDTAGFRLYKADGTVTVNMAAADGSATFAGTVGSGAKVIGAEVYAPTDATDTDRIIVGRAASGVYSSTAIVWLIAGQSNDSPTKLSQVYADADAVHGGMVLRLNSKLSVASDTGVALALDSGGSGAGAELRFNINDSNGNETVRFRHPASGITEMTVVQRARALVQQGSVNITTSTSGTTPVTFPQVFSAAPNIGVAVNDSDFILYHASLAATGFTMGARKWTGSGSETVTCRWVAVSGNA